LSTKERKGKPDTTPSLDEPSPKIISHFEMEAVAPFIMPLTLFVCKRNTTPRRAFEAFCYPHHVSTSMKKIVDLLVKTPKNLYDKREKHIH
jgi:hypothetical protein